MPSREDLLAAGVPEEAIVERSDHPGILASTWDISAADMRVSQREREYHLPHLRPQSLLVCTIGNLWDEGCWWRLQDCLLATAEAGYSVSLQEFKDPSLFSFEAIPMMRWSASMMARDGGAEWCLMVDNDVWMEKDTIVRLLAHDRPVVFPYIEDMEKRLPRIIAPLSGPDIQEPGHGLVPVRWSAMSVMLFNARIFNHLEPTAWRGSDYLFAQCLNNMGHRIYVDTDTVVRVTHGPTRHASKQYDEFWTDHKKMQERLRTEWRDRRPPPGFNPETDDGFVDRYGTYYGMKNSVAKREKAAEPPLRKEAKLWTPTSR